MHLHIAFYMLENVGLFCRGVTVSLWLENVSLKNSGTRLRILSSRRESQHKNVLKNLHRSFCRFSPLVERFNSRRLYRFALSVFKIPWLNLSVHGSQLPLMVFIYNCRNKKNNAFEMLLLKYPFINNWILDLGLTSYCEVWHFQHSWMIFENEFFFLFHRKMD